MTHVIDSAARIAFLVIVLVLFSCTSSYKSNDSIQALWLYSEGALIVTLSNLSVADFGPYADTLIQGGGISNLHSKVYVTSESITNADRVLDTLKPSKHTSVRIAILYDGVNERANEIVIDSFGCRCPLEGSSSAHLISDEAREQWFTYLPHLVNRLDRTQDVLPHTKLFVEILNGSILSKDTIPANEILYSFVQSSCTPILRTTLH